MHLIEAITLVVVSLLAMLITQRAMLLTPTGQPGVDVVLIGVKWATHGPDGIHPTFHPHL